MNDNNTINVDVLIVGAGPSGLSAAIHLADNLKKTNLKKRIMVIEKGSEVGAHILSGAIIKSEAFKELLSQEEFEQIPFDCDVVTDNTLRLSENGHFNLPFHLPYMDNMDNKIASLGQICRYLAGLAEEKGVEVYPGFSASELLYKNDKVIGIKTMDTGVDIDGKRHKNYQEGTSVLSKVTILSEGTRGSLAKTLKDKLNLRENSNAQVYSLAIKELWSVPQGNIKEGSVIHTFGYPLNVSEEFGGGFIYGLKDNKVALGFAVGLDYKDPTLDPHALMQIWKQHPYVKKILEGGNILEFGAKSVPEGGWNSISKIYADNVLILGDSAGFVAMPALKGIHLSVTSGICAAKTIMHAFKQNDTSESTLCLYKKLIDDSMIKKDMYPVRNFRAVMTQGMYIGGLKFGVGLLTNGACLLTPKLEKDNSTLDKTAKYKGMFFKERFKDKLDYDKKLTFNKVTSVFYSGTHHEEGQIPHLHVKDDKTYRDVNIKEYGMPSQYFCPADVYEEHVDKQNNHILKLHAENCVHCKTCDIKAPNDAITWMTPYGSDGPQYKYM